MRNFHNFDLNLLNAFFVITIMISQIAMTNIVLLVSDVMYSLMFYFMTSLVSKLFKVNISNVNSLFPLEH